MATDQLSTTNVKVIVVISVGRPLYPLSARKRLGRTQDKKTVRNVLNAFTENGPGSVAVTILKLSLFVRFANGSV